MQSLETEVNNLKIENKEFVRCVYIYMREGKRERER